LLRKKLHVSFFSVAVYVQLRPVDNQPRCPHHRVTMMSFYDVFFWCQQKNGRLKGIFVHDLHVAKLLNPSCWVESIS